MVPGYVGGTRSSERGGGSNHLCLRRDPIFGRNAAGSSRAYVHGAEYKNPPLSATSAFHARDVPCAVCVTPRKLVLMMPGRNQCDDGWHTEYAGYLSAESTAGYRTEFVCADSEVEANPHGSSDDQTGVLFFPAQVKCGSLPCGPYEDRKDLLCVVCSR